jgi:hypothetical protein
LLDAPLSEPPLPWLDCAKAGTAANDKMQAVHPTKTDCLSWVGTSGCPFRS